MSTQWAVLVRTGTDTGLYLYGPFDDSADAGRFSAFMTAEVDPASVLILRSPMAELLTFLKNQRDDAQATIPVQWPPQPGDVWQDRDGDRWICTRTPGDTHYLVCIAKQADDSAEEIRRLYGPLKWHAHLAPNVEEPPF